MVPAFRTLAEAEAEAGIDGAGTQNAIGNTVGHDLVLQMTSYVRSRPAMYLGAREIDERVAAYVPARNHDLVVKTLAEDRAVALAGPDGCGREITAIAAIRQLSPGIRIRRFSLEDEDAGGILGSGDCGYLIRAGDGLAGLARCVEAVRAAGGYLAVVGSGRETQPLSGTVRWMVVEPPHPVQVYRQRVAALPGWPHWDEAPRLLEHALPGDARRLARLVAEVEPRGGDPYALQTQVARAYRRWHDELARWFGEHTEPHERTLLIAAAALAPVADETPVYAAAAALAERLAISVSGAGLAWHPAAGLRALVGAAAGENGVVFHRHGYAHSVLRHALADYPLARRELLGWLAALPGDPAIDRSTGQSLAGTFADLAAEHGAAGQIIEAAGRWGKADDADLAFIVLSRACLHPRAGGRVRRALSDWSRSPGTAQTLKLTIARVCEPLGQALPLIALTRLKHLAANGNRQVMGEVVKTAVSLAASGHHAEVRRAALAWCAPGSLENMAPGTRQRRRQAGTAVFLELAAPVTGSGLPRILTGDEPADPAECVPGWRSVLDAEAAAGTRGYPVRDVIETWLDAAARHPAWRGRLTGMFVAAAMPSAAAPGGGLTRRTAAGVMIGLARAWAAVNPRDPVSRGIKEDILLPLTRPWVLRLLTVGWARLRDRMGAGRRR